MSFRLLLILVASSTLLISCLKDKAQPRVEAECGIVVSYVDDIVPIINTSCVTNDGPGTGCHDAWIFDYGNLAASVASGSLGNRVFSLRDMPVIPNSFGIDSLTADEFKTFQCWIEQGYPEN